MSARRRTACAMLPSRAPETVLSPSAISRTNRNARNEYGDRRYRTPVSLISVSSHRCLTHHAHRALGERSPCHSLSSRASCKASATRSWNHSADTDPSTGSRCSANRGSTQSRL